MVERSCLENRQHASARGFESHPLRHLLVLFTIAALVTSCALFARRFELAFRADGARDELPVIVVDETGMVTSVANVQRDPSQSPLERGMSSVPGSPNAVVVFWTDDPCDDSVTVTASGSNSLTLAVVMTRSPTDCPAVLFDRAIRIELGRPVDFSRTTVTFEP